MSQPGYQPMLNQTGVPQPSEPIRPSLWWIAAGILVAVVGFVGAFVVGFGDDDMSDRVSQLQRVPVPGSGDIQLSADQDYLGYVEYDGASSAALQDEVSATLLDPAGHAVPLGQLGSRSSYYQSGDREGRSAFAFRTDVNGTYHLTVEGPPGTTIAVGTDVSPGLIKSIVVGFLIIGAGFIAGAAIVVSVIIRRDRHRRRLLIAAASAMATEQPTFLYTYERPNH